MDTFTDGWDIKLARLRARRSPGSYADVQAAARQSAFHPLSGKARPSTAQAQASNYAVGRLSLAGLQVCIETPYGTERSGTDADGTPWCNTMAAHYGYIAGTRGADGDPVDIFIGPAPEQVQRVWVLNQTNADGSFDEHKVLFGFTGADHALNAYRASYTVGWKRYGPPLELSMTQLHWWLKWADKRLPISHDLLPAHEPANTAMDSIDTTVPRALWQANAVPACGQSITDVWAELSRHDGAARLLLDAVSMRDIHERVALDGFFSNLHHKFFGNQYTNAGTKAGDKGAAAKAARSAQAKKEARPHAQFMRSAAAHGKTEHAMELEDNGASAAELKAAHEAALRHHVHAARNAYSGKNAEEHAKAAKFHASKLARLKKSDKHLFDSVSGTIEADELDDDIRDVGLDELLASVDAVEIPGGQDGRVALDAIVTEAGRLKPRMDSLMRVMVVAADEKVKPLMYQISEPLKRHGGLHIAVLFELTDGQSVTVWFHNPDSTPAKISPLDKLVSWKWMLNKKDITLTVAPEAGADLDVREVARRVMALALKNSPTFARANTNRTERMQRIDGMKDELATKQAFLKDLNGQIEVAQEAKRMQGAETPAPAAPVSATRSGSPQEQAVADAALAMAAGVVADLGGTFGANGFSAPGTAGAWSYGKAVVNGKDVSLAASGGGVVQVNGKPHDPQGSVIMTAEQVRAAILAVAPAAEENQPGSDIAPEGRENVVKTAKGNKVTTGFAVVEAARLIVSHDADGNANPDYPMELQPRDRGRATSQAWVKKTAQSLDPESLGRTTRADTGAPIVGKDRVVESGNGRTMAIIEAYRIGKADEYRAWLEEEAAYFGINPDKVRAMKRPVLVRVRTSEVDRRAFAVEANQDDKLGMTATEKARSDAKRLDSALLSHLPADGDLTATGAREFLAGFLKSLGDAEAAQYITSDGKPTASLIARVQAAIFAKAYADDRLLELTADSAKPEIANIVSALNAAAPDFVRAMDMDQRTTESATQALTDGIELSLNQQAVGAIIGATNVVKQAREAGMQVEEFVKQQGLFGDVDPAVAAVAVFIAKNNRSAKRLGSAFKAMAQFIGSELQRSQTADMFGAGSAQVSMADVVAAANRQLEKEYGEGAFAIEQFGLFGGGAQPAPDVTPPSDIAPTPLPDEPHMVSFDVFLKHAQVQKLEGHGRKWEVKYILPSGVSDHGFSDANTAEEAVRDIHRGLVNNALFANTPDQLEANKGSKPVQVPPKSVLDEYPDLVSLFPDVFSVVSDAQILAAYRKIIQASNGTRSMVEIGELHRAVGGPLGGFQDALQRLVKGGGLANAYFVKGDPAFLSAEDKSAGLKIGEETYYAVDLPMSDAPARPASSKPPENPQRATALATLNQIASGQHPDMLNPDLYGVVEDALNAYPGDTEIEAAATAAVDAMEAGNLSATAKF